MKRHTIYVFLSFQQKILTVFLFIQISYSKQKPNKGSRYRIPFNGTTPYLQEVQQLSCIGTGDPSSFYTQICYLSHFYMGMDVRGALI